jgi:hypothetical protein
MTGRWSMRGRWSGVYVYDESPECPADLPSFGFTLDITEEWEGRFRGAAQDDYLSGVAEQGSVQGRVVGEELEFVKRVPLLYLIEAASGGGLRSTDQCRHHRSTMRVRSRPKGKRLPVVGGSSRLQSRSRAAGNGMPLI